MSHQTVENVGVENIRIPHPSTAQLAVLPANESQSYFLTTSLDIRLSILSETRPSHDSKSMASCAECLPGPKSACPCIFDVTVCPSHSLGTIRSHIMIPSKVKPNRSAAATEALFSVLARHWTRLGGCISIRQQYFDGAYATDLIPACSNAYRSIKLTAWVLTWVRCVVVVSV